MNNNITINNCQPVVQYINDPSSTSNTYYNRCGCPPSNNVKCAPNSSLCLIKLSTKCSIYDGPNYFQYGILSNQSLDKVLISIIDNLSGGEVNPNLLFTTSGDGSTFIFTTPNTIEATIVNIQPLTVDAQGILSYSVTGGNIQIIYDVAPLAGTNNLSYNIIKVQ